MRSFRSLRDLLALFFLLLGGLLFYTIIPRPSAPPLVHAEKIAPPAPEEPSALMKQILSYEPIRQLELFPLDCLQAERNERAPPF